MRRASRLCRRWKALFFPAEDGKLLGRGFGEGSEEWQLKGNELRNRLEELRRANPGGVPMVLGASRRIGVAVSPLGRQLADYFGVGGGVLISSVEPNSPAEKAGLKAGDIITETDGAKVEDVDDLAGALNRKEVGEVTLTIVRDKKQRTVRVTPERRETEGIYIRPGSFRIEGPVAALALPRERMETSDDYLPLPQIHSTPPQLFITPPQVHVSPARARIATPPVRVMTPRVRVFSNGERIL